MSRGTRRALVTLGCLIFLAGLVLALYSPVTHYFKQREMDDALARFDALRVEENAVPEGDAPTPPSMYPELWTQFYEYNKDLAENGQDRLNDPFAFEDDVFDLVPYGLEDDLIGEIEIPRLSLTLPLYLGATTEHMKKGAVQLTYSSAPIGGKSTNCVIAAHRGYASAAMFRDIQNIQIGDEVFVTNLWETLTYQAVETKVILPTEIDQVLIQEGKDRITLITCNPYRHNYQRYVVYCERVTE